ncbi:hypothetical protein AAW14_28650, partial [Streptomyces hygroscopicus]|nr:hypothetical protein [Streptomyces hygroscopicus]
MARAVVGVGLGVDRTVGVGGPLVGDAEGEGLELGDGTALVAGAAADTVAADAGEPSDGDSSGTLARMSSGSASSRRGGLYENSPAASPAAATA